MKSWIKLWVAVLLAVGLVATFALARPRGDHAIPPGAERTPPESGRTPTPPPPRTPTPPPPRPPAPTTPERTPSATPKSPVEIKMVRIPAGRFLMGSPDNEAGREAYREPLLVYHEEGPQHWVQISHDFLLGTTPVTWSQWRRVLGGNPTLAYNRQCRSEDCPVEAVNWYDAVNFCNRLSDLEHLPRCYSGERDRDIAWVPGCLGYRLPTEAEWEYAARAGSTTAFPNGGITAITNRCEADRHRLVLRQFRTHRSSRGTEAAQRLGLVRYARQRFAMGLGSERLLSQLFAD
jgi:formylglycine-generating enzyme required for sulfatase activity